MLVTNLKARDHGHAWKSTTFIEHFDEERPQQWWRTLAPTMSVLKMEDRITTSVLRLSLSAQDKNS